MSLEAVERVFPTRMLQPSESPRRAPVIIFGCAALLFAAAGIWIFTEYLPSLLADTALAASTRRADQASAAGECSTTRGILTTCTLIVRYASADKSQREIEIPYMLVGQAAELQTIDVLLGPPGDDRVATSWGARQTTRRWIALVAVAAALWAFTVAFGIGAIRALRRPARLRVLAALPNPVAVTLRAPWRAGPVTTWKYHGTIGGRRFRGSQNLIGAEPLFLNPGTETALALVSADGFSLLLDDNLNQLRLSEDERARIIQAARA